MQLKKIKSDYKEKSDQRKTRVIRENLDIVQLHFSINNPRKKRWVEPLRQFNGV